MNVILVIPAANTHTHRHTRRCVCVQKNIYNVHVWYTCKHVEIYTYVVCICIIFTHFMWVIVRAQFNDEKWTFNLILFIFPYSLLFPSPQNLCIVFEHHPYTYTHTHTHFCFLFSFFFLFFFFRKRANAKKIN